MGSERAIVRLLGPRRIGKTELVSNYARTCAVPILNINIKPIAPDLAPSLVVRAVLAREITGLAATAPDLLAAYSKLRARVAPTPTIDADMEVAYTLRWLELAAGKLEIRPIIFFDEIHELVLKSNPDVGMATVWAIRNEIQQHRHCRYVFSSGNQRLFSQLDATGSAPLLHLGTLLESSQRS